VATVSGIYDGIRADLGRMALRKRSRPGRDSKGPFKKPAEIRRSLPLPRVARAGEVGVMETVRRVRDGEQ
jgi:hypothetical protein